MAKGEKINGEPAVVYWQKMPYELKKAHAASLVREFYNQTEIAGNVYVSVGGLDSITLAVFVRTIYPNVRLASVSGLEHPTNQRVHKALGVETVPRGRDKNGEAWTLPKVYKELGYPLFSKEKAEVIPTYWKTIEEGKPRESWAQFLKDFERVNDDHTDDCGRAGRASHYRMAKRYWNKVKEGRPAGFTLSRECCKKMKEKPIQDWAKNNGLFPYLGLMLTEEGQRQTSLKEYGCNYVSDNNIWRSRSCPFASFTRDDLLRLALEMNDYYKEHWQEFNTNPADRVETIVPAVYGVIEEYYTIDGEKHYRTTGAQRTGCTVCGFGAHIRRPNSFDKLREDNQKAWAVAMKSTAEGGWGWGDVLDHFGIEWRTPPKVEEQTDFYSDIGRLLSSDGRGAKSN